MNIPKNKILQLLNELDTQQEFGGLIPISIIYKKLKEIVENSSIQIHDFHTIILEMESNNEIYLEPINDPSRLSIDEQSLAIIDKIRGSLFYIGCR